jgi:hypothetical protein
LYLFSLHKGGATPQKCGIIEIHNPLLKEAYAMRRYICVVGIALAALGSSYAQTLVSIGNGISGDGRLTIPVDPFGAWYANFSNAANRGEFYDPPGTLGADYPTFATGTYLFVGTSYRVALNQEPGWGGILLGQVT